MFDVIVCGAGPAGAVAAAVLARGGARVLLLDRARFPRPKLCGDTINPGSLALLQRLGMLAPVEPGALRLKGMIVTGEHGVRVRCAYTPGVHALSIPRSDLDAAIADAAVAAGARFEQGIVRRPLLDDASRPCVRGVVIAGRDGQDLRVPAPLVIAADGRRSHLAIPLGLARTPRHPRRWAIGAYFSDVEGLEPFGEMHVRRGQYLGIAPVPGGLANVCLVVPAGPRSTRGGEPSGLSDPASLLQRAINLQPALRERFARARRIGSPVVIGPLAVDAASAGTDGLLLAGDAAGFIDPITGDGLRFAIRGGELAAQAALATLAGRLKEPHRRLTLVRAREFGRKWRFNRAVRRLVSSSASVEIAGVVASAVPWVMRRTVDFAGDVPSAQEMPS